jgi:hypothetical protein
MNWIANWKGHGSSLWLTLGTILAFTEESLTKPFTLASILTNIQAGYFSIQVGSITV